MKYELKIAHALDTAGSIDLQRLSSISDSLRKIAEGALMLRLKGLSKAKKSFKLEDALRITLTGLEKGSTILCLHSQTFEKTLPSFQTNLFRIAHQQDLPHKTPISLVAESFQAALDNPDESELLDKPLLKELLNFKKSFKSDEEVFSIKNEGSFAGLSLRKSDFKKIQLIEEEIPASEAVLINGRIEELKFSTQKVRILTKEGLVDAFLSEKFDTDKISDWWGKEATVVGTKHYKPGKRFAIEIEQLVEQGGGDSFFSKKPRHENLEEQINRQLKEGKEINPLSLIVGSWPGSETDEEFEASLKELD
ncbi:hypothetical protein PBT90_11060 [Algoriphagus halophytocola]|uniref:hypothetical protein n=1 Tax=Algoriphagus halophytocola TaxID=2991499 RepID=UPI0022DDD4BD|nr:hypothetical protein [Algoriphagus sp. TR-M9]WBL41295.1 hypothetical protein PBT90_11060 [Algoriphagus sp. TR-M9]